MAAISHRSPGPTLSRPRTPVQLKQTAEDAPPTTPRRKHIRFPSYPARHQCTPDPMPFSARPNRARARSFTPAELQSITARYDCAVIDQGDWIVLERAPPADRPFTVGGKFAYFLDPDADETLPYGLSITLLGDVALSTEFYTLPDEEADADLRGGDIPKITTFDCIYQRVPTASYISYCNRTLLLEFPEVSPEEHARRLESVPVHISGVLVLSLNGPWEVVAHGSRKTLPNPRLADGAYDDTDYLPDELCPGVMLSGCFADGTTTTTTSGVLLHQRATGRRRLTVSEHGFAPRGAVWHPDQTGTQIGTVTEVKENTDIGLVDIGDVPYSNANYFGVGPIRGLLSAAQLRAGQVYQLDSFVTGLQRVVCVGVRTAPRRMQYGNKKFMAYQQGIYSATDPIIARQPQIRLGACGSPLVALDPAMHGLVGGFQVWVDVRPYSGANLLSLCDVCDPLMEEGWEVLV